MSHRKSPAPRYEDLPARSFLYVPGDRPDRLAKSGQRGADAIIVDLEDAVLPDAKGAALDNATAWLRDRDPSGPAAWARINTGPDGSCEVRELARSTGLKRFIIPKVESPGQIEAVSQAAREAGVERPLLAPMIESAAGVVRVEELAQVPGVYQLHLGEVDLAADLGLEPTMPGTELLYARARVVVASRFAGLPAPCAPVSTSIDDHAGFRSETEALRRLGFYGRDCIHPAQVIIATDVFTPSAEARAWAQSLLDQSMHAAGAFRDADGAMVDEAVLRKARRILELTGPT
jgi:citrate lyase subunit beta/citryl-CoA lyase